MEAEIQRNEITMPLENMKNCSDLSIKTWRLLSENPASK